MSTRNVYLLSIPFGDARPHWVIWIPNVGEDVLGVGKKIHAVGAPQTGFSVQVEHGFSDYKLAKTGSALTAFLLGNTDLANIVDGERSTDYNTFNKQDAFERLAETVQAPRISQGSIPTGLPSVVKAALRHDISGLKRCQEWTMEYIEALIKKKLLPQSALEAVANARALNLFPSTA